MAPHNVDRNGEAGEHWQQKELGQQRMGRKGSRSPPKVVLQTKEMITKQAGKIAKRADEHEAFITKVTYSMGVASFGTFCFWLGSSKSIAGSCSMSSAYICSDSRLPKICFCNLFVHLSSPPMICGSL
jgi:hypothetical protein